MEAHDSAPLLEVRGLRTAFRSEGGDVVAVRDLSFTLHRGETLGIVGESGSGKSVTQLSLLGLLPSPPARIEAGQALFDGENLLAMSQEELRRIRGRKIAMIFQDPMTSLNPFLRVGTQLMEVLETHTTLPAPERRARAIALLQQVGIPEATKRMDQYPHELSGGMRQRVMIAMALLCDPELLVADEPTTALDVTIQAQILELLQVLKTERGTAIVLITHDLGVVAGMADRVLVMYAGSVMEEAPTAALFAGPHHPYTIGLLRSLPRLDAGDRQALVPIPGQPPDLARLPDGCPFAPRCPFAIGLCHEAMPDERVVGPDHRVRCHRPEVAAWHASGLVRSPADEEASP